MQQDASQQTTSRACKPRSDPSLATWTHWAAAPALNPQWASCPQVTTPALSHVPCAALAGREPNPNYSIPHRSQPRRSAPQCHVLLLLSETNGSIKIRRGIASIARTQRRRQPRSVS